MAGTSQNFVARGWSIKENGLRWTDGKEAVLRLHFDQPVSEDVVLSMTASGMAPDAHSPQNVAVFANGRPVANWAVMQEETLMAVIPKAELSSDSLTLTFQIERPYAPCKVSDSSDCRQLGMAVSRLTLAAAR